MNEAEKIIAMLKAVRTMTGIPLLWRFPPLRYFDPEYCHHCNAFCLKVKSLPGRTERCNHDDSTGLTDAAVAAGLRRLVKKCHAGVWEMVMPVFENGELTGALVFGPFRPEGPCPYPEAVEEYGELPRYETFRLKTEVEALLVLLADYLVKAGPSVPILGGNDDRVVAGMGYIDANCHRKLGVAEVAARCFLSKSRFEHLFVRESGMTFREYVGRARVRKAEKLLLLSNRSLSEIAAQSGFCSQSHFTAAFRRCFGLTPLAYRRKFR